MMNRHIKLFLIGMCAAGAVAVFSVADVRAFLPPIEPIDMTPKFTKLAPKLPKLDLILPKVKNTEEFCSKFSEKASTIAERLAERQTKVTNFINEHESSLGERRDNRDANLADLRSKADQKRSEWYVRLQDRADTDAQKDAVLKFKQTVEDAVDTRRETVNDAIAAFRNGVDTAIAGRKDDMKSARDKFKTSVDAAVAKVKTDCDNGETTVTIRSNFKTSLQMAREALKTDKNNVDKVGAQVKALADGRSAIVKKAIADFNAALQKALADLKQVLG
jgi:hypothetical protein